MLAQLFDVRAIHVLEILHIFEEDSGMADVVQIGSQRFQHDLERF
jgi:hypothetical protein